ncbi:hypothetical protein B0T09DRAFT_274103, partial [Sordaria sp. MPI-SDFR-AT-0083]
GKDDNIFCNGDQGQILRKGTKTRGKQAKAMKAARKKAAGAEAEVKIFYMHHGKEQNMDSNASNNGLVKEGIEATNAKSKRIGGRKTTTRAKKAAARNKKDGKE